MDIDEQRRAAAELAAAEVQPGMVVGLGVGRAAEAAIRALAQRVAVGEVPGILGVPCSHAIASLATELGIPLTTLDAHPLVDLTLDGADEVDANGNLIKGAGGALLHEKIVAQASRREIIVVDEGKMSEVLGERWRLPIEVIPFAMGAVAHYLTSIGGQPEPRRAKDGSLYCTQEGNHIIDCGFGRMPRPAEIAAQLDGRAGIVEHGLFLNLATDVVIGCANYIRVQRRPTGNAPEVRPSQTTVFPNVAVLSTGAAAEVVRIAHAAVAARGRFLLALSGGSTPRRLYETLAGGAGDALPWAATHLFWGDERCVPPDHPASNYGMAKAALLDHVPVPAANVHRIPAEADSPDAAATAYEQEMRRVWGDNGTPVFDLVLLGLGADGHTASLFPGGPELDDTERLAVAVTAPATYDPRWRISLTLPVLNAARAVLFLVAGADKRPALRALLDGKGAGPYPAAHVRPAGVLSWYMDRAAYS